LIRFQVHLEGMMRKYAKMEEFNFKKQGIITGLECTCQDFKEQQLVVHIEFDKEKQSLTAQSQD
jgi:hypothetical protein